MSVCGKWVWRLVWRVWDATLRSKDEEIKRLVEERDKYQKLVFERLLSSAPVPDSGKPEEPKVVQSLERQVAVKDGDKK